MEDDARKPTYDELAALVVDLKAQVERLEQELADTRSELADTKRQLAAATKNSRNSSKPPSSDIAKPPKSKPKGRGKRKKGGQHGHPKHSRPAFKPDEIDETVEHAPAACPDCGGTLEDDGAATVHQQAELVAKPIRVTDHRATPRRCAGCGRKVKPTLPNGIRAGGLCGPHLTAFAAFLKGGCHASTSTVRSVFADVLGLPLSSGFVMKMLAKTTAALEEPYVEALTMLPEATAVNADETGHRENGERWWTWVFRTAGFTLFRIADSRGSKVLDDTLGPDFAGFLGADYFSAYRKYMENSNALVQFCLAHLIRDVRFLCESTDKVTANYGERVLACLRRLFDVLHREDELTPAGYQRRLEEERDKLLATAKRPPPRSDAQNLADRFREYGDEYVRFLTSPEIAPTNNAAEQAIRFCVIDRRITQGTRSEKGRRWCERIWTASATCAQQGRSLFRSLEAAITAHFHQLPAPSLIPRLTAQL
jgi:transposase